MNLHIDLVESQLDATKARILEAGEALAARDRQSTWLDGSWRREAQLEQREHERGPVPSAWPRTRLGLTASEARVLWVLIAHELDPEARKALRALNTEELSDVTLDTLKRVVYGSRPERVGWRELAPESALRRWFLIERSDGTAEVPAQRMTFRVARRVLALAHGDVGLDEELAGIAQLPDAEPTAPALEALVVGDCVRDRVRELARKFVMSGGYIRNAMLRAAFLAADGDEPIGPVHLVQAAQLEYEAMGKIAPAPSGTMYPASST
jgi:hypothetical protein